jgi:uncharacterized protein (DUF2267 family)
MSSRGLEGIDETVQATHIWINDTAQELGIEDKHRAYLVLRAFLHAIREHLQVDESAQFAAQLPMLLRGLYYEGWQPAKVPVRERTRDAFLQRIEEEAALDGSLPAEKAAWAAAAVIEKHVDPGEYEHVLGMIPGKVREIFAPSGR